MFPRSGASTCDSTQLSGATIPPQKGRIKDPRIVADWVKNRHRQEPAIRLYLKEFRPFSKKGTLLRS